jgi:hypothetical protein
MPSLVARLIAERRAMWLRRLDRLARLLLVAPP